MHRLQQVGPATSAAPVRLLPRERPPLRTASRPSPRLLRGVAIKKHPPRFDALGVQQRHCFPGIVREPLSHPLLRVCFDYVENTLAVAEWTTKYDEAAFRKPVHERCVLWPGALLMHGTVGLPRWAANADDCEQARAFGH